MPSVLPPGAAIVIATALASLMVGWWSGSRPLISTLLVSGGGT